MGHLTIERPNRPLVESPQDDDVGEAAEAGLEAGGHRPEVQVGGYEGGQEMVGAVVEDVLELLGDLPLQVL